MDQFGDLELSDTCLSLLGSVGITAPRDLARLALHAFEEPVGERPSPLVDLAVAGCRRLADDLYNAFVVAERVDPLMRMEQGEVGRDYLFEIDCPTVRLNSRLRIEERYLDGDFGASDPAAEPLYTGARYLLVDPLADLRRLLASLVDPLGTPRDRDRISQEEADILRRRFGLDGQRKSTLDELGTERGCTRERIRQLEVRCLKLMRRTSNLNRLKRLTSLVESLAGELEASVDSQLAIGALGARFPALTEDAQGWLRLLSAIHGPAWAYLEMREYPGLKGAVLRVLSTVECCDLAELVRDVATQLDIDPTPGVVARVLSLDICSVDGSTVRLASANASRHVQRMRAICGFLSGNGASHFEEIATAIAPELGAAALMSPRNVHAWLDRNQDIFVWVGPGTYRLRAEGDEARERESLPAEYAPSRRRGIGDAIVRLLLEQQPRTLDEIESLILPHFAVHRGSVGASILQDRAGRFVMTDERLVFLRDADIAAFEAERPRASGLIDWSEVAAQLVDLADPIDI